MPGTSPGTTAGRKLARRRGRAGALPLEAAEPHLHGGGRLDRGQGRRAGERLLQALVAAVDVVAELDDAVGRGEGGGVEQVDAPALLQLDALRLAGGHRGVDLL